VKLPPKPGNPGVEFVLFLSVQRVTLKAKRSTRGAQTKPVGKNLLRQGHLMLAAEPSQTAFRGILATHSFDTPLRGSWAGSKPLVSRGVCRWTIPRNRSASTCPWKANL